MKVQKIGKLLAALMIIFVSVLIVTRTVGFCHAQNPINDEDMLQKGNQLLLDMKLEEAYGSFRVAWLLAATVDNNPERAMLALKGMGDCAFWIGAVDSCVYRYRQAASLAHELGRPYVEYEIYSQLKQAYLAKVDMQNVLLTSQKIDSLASNVDDMRIRIDFQQRLAQEAIQQENPKLAEHYLLANEILLDSLTSEDRQSTQFIVYGYLRDFYFGLQDFDKARKYSQLYIAAGKEGFKQQQIGYINYDSEALICAQQKDRKASFEALDSMKYGLTLNSDTNPIHIMHYYDVRGRVHAMFGEWEQARDSYRKALDAVKGTPASNRVDYFRIVQLLGVALNNTKEYDEARACHAEFGRYCKFLYGEESLAYADALWTLANFEGYCGELEAGKQYYISSVDICKKVVESQLKYVSVQERNAFWYNFAPKMFAMAAYAIKIKEQQSLFTEKCYEALLFSKALLLESDRSMASAINNNCTPEEQRVYYEMIGFQNQLKMLMNDYEKNKERIEALHQKMSVQDKRLTPIISKLGYTSFLDQDYGYIKRLLKDDEVLLDFTDFVSDENLHQHACFVVNQEQRHPRLIKAFSEEAVKQVLVGKNIDCLYLSSNSEKTLKLIWQPLKEDVQGKRTIYYVPSGLMHQIALESIPLKDGSLLGDHYHFVRLTSAREIEKVKNQNDIKDNSSAILYGGLKYDVDTTLMVNEASLYKIEPILAFNRGETVRGDKRFRELPNAKEEIDKIETILKRSNVNVTPRTGTKGTEESFLTLSGNPPNILHIATHGFYYTPDKAQDVSYLKGYNNAMMLSGLIMSGGNQAWTGNQIPKGVMGGILTANTIAYLDLKGTDLLVLSACQTGQGMATPEGLYGLQRAFKKAGVQTMVLTLWNINDKVAKEFMIKFYEELADSRNHWDKRKAFENAKAYIRNTRQYHDPYYWAGFVMLD